MIKLTGINKFYNKNKSNEIHVINNVNLQLPQTGLVALLGKSGCGKTTLLNVMGGLDKADRGLIEIDDIVLKGYNAKKWDAVRSRKIGYVFQNYYLFNDKTVYENLEMALNLAGVYDKKEIDDRINYSLELVGLSKYRKRRPSTLSGGQQQRVGIARALVKSPSVIIADEPTGNLDSRNTFEVMDKLKSISKFCLVVLVTHEQKIAEFFADRIIMLQDGAIIEDNINSNELNLDVKEKNDIFLNDLKSDKGKFGNNITVQHYYQKEPINDITIDIVELEGRVYLRANSKNIPISIVDDRSEVNLIEDSYKVKNSAEYVSVEINRDILGPVKNAKKGTAIKTSVALKNAAKKYFAVRFRKKFFSHLLLTASAFLLVLSLAFGANSLVFDKSSYTRDTRLIEIQYSDTKLGDVRNAIGSNGIDNVLTNKAAKIYIEPISYSSNTPFSNSTMGGNIITTDLFPLMLMKANSPLIKGEKSVPEVGEAVIDIKTADEAMLELKLLGVNRDDFLIGEKILVNVNEGSETINKQFVIVGIINSGVSGVFITNEEHELLLDECDKIRTFSIISNNKSLTTTYLGNKSVIYDPYQEALNQFSQARSILGYVIGGILIAIAVVIITVTKRNVKAGFIDRVKDIGTYRCIGASKLDVTKEFIFESLLTTTLSSFIGFAFGSYVVRQITQVLANYPVGVVGFYYPIWLMLFAGIFVYGINLILSVTRVNRLMFSTPAQIMAKYDI